MELSFCSLFRGRHSHDVLLARSVSVAHKQLTADHEPEKRVSAGRMVHSLASTKPAMNCCIFRSQLLRRTHAEHRDTDAAATGSL